MTLTRLVKLTVTPKGNTIGAYIDAVLSALRREVAS